MVTGNKLQDALLLMKTVVKQDKVPTILVVVKDLLTEALGEHTALTIAIKEGCDHYDTLETYHGILEDLALPDTSLYWCNALYNHLKELEQKYINIYRNTHYKFIIGELDKAIKCIINLEFKGALTGLLDLIQYIKTCPNEIRGSMELLDKAVIKTSHNVALKQYIFEGNITVA